MNFNPFRSSVASFEKQTNGGSHGTLETILRSESQEAEFQRVKTSIHRELLDSLDLAHRRSER